MAMSKLKVPTCLLLALLLLSSGAMLFGHPSSTPDLQPTPALAAQEPSNETPKLLDKKTELHVIGVYKPKDLSGKTKSINVEIQPTPTPIVLVLTSYFEANWKLKLAPGARLSKVMLGGYFEQAIEGVPANVPVVNCFPKPLQNRTGLWFFAYDANSRNYLEMIQKLNEATNLLVSSFQGEYEGTSFVVDGQRGSKFAQSERAKPTAFPPEPNPQQILEAAAGADLHVLAIAGPRAPCEPVDVEVRKTTKPVVLVLSGSPNANGSATWRLKLADGARLRLVVWGGWASTIEGLPAGVPVIDRRRVTAEFNDGRVRPEFLLSDHQVNTVTHQKMTEQLNKLTGLRVKSFQGQAVGTAFVVDDIAGREFEQTAIAPKPPTLNPAELLSNSKDCELPIAVVDGVQGKNFAEEPGVPPKAEPPQDPAADVADIPSQEVKAANDADKRYFLIGPKKDTTAPKQGYGLVIILPGGDGSAEFNPFVKRIYKNALSEEFIVAQPVAVKWTPNQQIVWPTSTNRVDKMKFTTEEFIDAVIEDSAKKFKVDRSRVFTLSWSSSGPAAYATSLQKNSKVTGSFIAMSIFNPKFLPPLDAAKGHPYYLYHSEQDRVCPYRMAQQAKSKLLDKGANVHLETYEGGHGWRGNLFDDIRTGIDWLEKNRDKNGIPRFRQGEKREEPSTRW